MKGVKKLTFQATRAVYNVFQICHQISSFQTMDDWNRKEEWRMKNWFESFSKSVHCHYLTNEPISTNFISLKRLCKALHFDKNSIKKKKNEDEKSNFYWESQNLVHNLTSLERWIFAYISKTGNYIHFALMYQIFKTLPFITLNLKLKKSLTFVLCVNSLETPCLFVNVFIIFLKRSWRLKIEIYF